MDASGSIGDIDFIKEQQFVKALINNLEIGENASRVSIIAFSNYAQILLNFAQGISKDVLTNAVDNFWYSGGMLEKKIFNFLTFLQDSILLGGTNTAEALNVANNVILTEENGMRPLKEGIPKVVLVITDGESNDRSETLIEADKIKMREFNIISIGVGNINRDELLAMSTTADDFYFVENFNKILDIIKGIARTTCQQPAEIDQNNEVVNEVLKDSYKYYKFPLSTLENNQTLRSKANQGYLIKLEILSGMSELFYSFEDKTPKSNNDFVQNSDNSDRDDNFYETYLKRAKRDSSKVKFYEINLQNNSETLYISVRGMADGLNEFRIQILDHKIDKNTSSIIPFSVGLLVVIIIGIAIIASIALLVAFIIFKKKKVVVRPMPIHFKK